MASRIVPEGGHRLKPFKTPRVENRRHLDFIKQLPCVCCMVRGIVVQADDPMHIRAGSALHGKEPAGAGQTADDRWTLPGCRAHHDEQHGSRDAGELAFWNRFGIDPFLLALVLWGLTGDTWAAVQVVQAHARMRPALRGS
jgi:hypothetical protein